MKWISCKDKKPPTGKRVLFMAKYDMDIHFGSAELAMRANGTGVTYWMPLPETPEEYKRKPKNKWRLS